jgi:putative cell wall-binding protein
MRQLVTALLVVCSLAMLGLAPTAGADGPQGAAAMKGETWRSPSASPEAAFTRAGAVTPATEQQAVGDRPSYYADGCHVGATGVTPLGCVYGDPGGDVEVAMVGDSKVGQWFAPLDTIARREGWRLRIWTKSACSFVPGVPRPDYPACDTYNDNLLQVLRASPPDRIVTSGQRRGVADAYTTIWTDLRSRGVDRIVALWDSPSPSTRVPACLEPLVPTGDYVASCSYTMSSLSGSETLEEAASRVAGAEYVDMRDWYCPESDLSPACPPVVGGAAVLADGTHLTETYTATLAEALHVRLAQAGFASAPPEVPLVERVGGSDRYATAALLAEAHAPGGPVYVATGQQFPDALAAASSAGAAGAPVLLTRTDALPSATDGALRRLEPSSITVVGGPAAVGDAVVTGLEDYTPGTVERVSGKDRYATAAELARRAGTGAATAYVATGADYPDALTSAALAGDQQAPLVLSRRAGLPAEVADALGALRPARGLVVGGEAALSVGVVAEVAARTTTGEAVRVSGADRYGTAATLAERYPPDVPVVYVATGAGYADALAAAALAGDQGAPVLLVRREAVPPATVAALERLRPQRIVVVGGPAAVAETVRWQLERHLR